MFPIKSPRPYSGQMCTKEDAAEDLGFCSFDKVYIECLFLEHHKYGGWLAVGGKGSLESWLINFPMMLSPPKHLQDGINLKYRYSQLSGICLQFMLLRTALDQGLSHNPRKICVKSWELLMREYSSRSLSECICKASQRRGRSQCLEQALQHLQMGRVVSCFKWVCLNR